MTEKLSDAICERAEGPPADGKRAYVILYDSEAKGFGLRTTKAGAKSFIFNYRIGGVERRFTIGTFKKPWKVAAARAQALRLRGLVDQGIDPQGEKHEMRIAPTINDLIDHWRTVHARRNRLRTIKENERLIRQWIKPEFGARRVADVRTTAIEALHHKIGTRTPTRANRVIALLSKMFALAVRAEWCDRNPCNGVDRNYEEPRTRYLKPPELARLTEALAAHKNRQTANAVRLLLLTGCCKNELLTATWNQFDLDVEEGIWTKPSSHTKQRREHKLPLSPLAVELLTAIREEQRRVTEAYNATRRPGQAKREPPVHIFPERTGTAPLTDIRDWPQLRAAAGLAGLRLHDLRHSHASILASAGLSLPIIGALLGHTQPSTTARYSHLFVDPLRAATGKVAEAVGVAGGKVVSLYKGDAGTA